MASIQDEGILIAQHGTGNSTVRFIVKGDPIVVLPECLTPLCNYKHVGRQYVCVEAEEIKCLHH